MISTPTAERTRTELVDAFQAETFPHVDTLFADALCLTGRQEAAEELILETYRRAFRGYDRFRCERVSECRWPLHTLAWLYRNLHAAFCDGVLARTPTGE